LSSNKAISTPVGATLIISSLFTKWQLLDTENQAGIRHATKH